MQLIFNDIAGSEVLLILVFVLIFFGAKSIPGLAKTLGRTIRQVKDASNEIQSEIRKSADEMKGDMNLKGILEETAQDVKRPLDQYATDIENSMKYTPPRKNTQLKAEHIENAEEIKEELPNPSPESPKVKVTPDSESQDSSKGE